MLRNLLRCALMAAMCSMTMLAVAHAQSAPPLDIHSEAVDVTQYPRSAIGKLYNETGGACTAVIVARDKVLTAASSRQCPLWVKSRRQQSSEHRRGGYACDLWRVPLVFDREEKTNQ
jgi:hypothetical protein